MGSIRDRLYSDKIEDTQGSGDNNNNSGKRRKLNEVDQFSSEVEIGNKVSIGDLNEQSSITNSPRSTESEQEVKELKGIIKSLESRIEELEAEKKLQVLNNSNTTIGSSNFNSNLIPSNSLLPSLSISVPTPPLRNQLPTPPLPSSSNLQFYPYLNSNHKNPFSSASSLHSYPNPFETPPRENSSIYHSLGLGGGLNNHCILPTPISPLPINNSLSLLPSSTPSSSYPTSSMPNPLLYQAKNLATPYSYLPQSHQPKNTSSSSLSTSSSSFLNPQSQLAAQCNISRHSSTPTLIQDDASFPTSESELSMEMFNYLEEDYISNLEDSKSIVEGWGERIGVGGELVTGNGNGNRSESERSQRMSSERWEEVWKVSARLHEITADVEGNSGVEK